MYYIKFDGWNGNATIYEFEKKVEIIHGTPVPMNRLISSETGLASDLLPKRGIVPVSDVMEVVNFCNVEYNIEGWCGRYGEGFNGAHQRGRPICYHAHHPHHKRLWCGFVSRQNDWRKIR